MAYIIVSNPNVRRQNCPMSYMYIHGGSLLQLVASIEFGHLKIGPTKLLPSMLPVTFRSEADEFVSNGVLNGGSQRQREEFEECWFV